MKNELSKIIATNEKKRQNKGNEFKINEKDVKEIAEQMKEKIK